jgi:hypothetical protein
MPHCFAGLFTIKCQTFLIAGLSNRQSSLLRTFTPLKAADMRPYSEKLKPHKKTPGGSGQGLQLDGRITVKCQHYPKVLSVASLPPTPPANATSCLPF